jgi:hypothetical protein
MRSWRATCHIIFEPSPAGVLAQGSSSGSKFKLAENRRDVSHTALGFEWEAWMGENGERYTGGCLCGQMRYEAEGEPLYAGLCFCTDCQKASGSGFVPFMGFASSAIRFSGSTRKFTSKAANGEDAVRNSCPVCGSLVFGGEMGKDETFTVYAGSLDDTSSFQPTAAIFVRSRPLWAVIPPHLMLFEAMPPT